jgi:hypothetical protein
MRQGNFPGRFFSVPILAPAPAPAQSGQAGLGELPFDQPILPPFGTPTRGGAPPLGGTLPPFGMPPPGGSVAPDAQGILQPTQANQSNWQTIVFMAGLSVVKVQDFTYRKFFLIQNKSAVGTMYVGFGYEPNAGNGLELSPGVGYEPFNYPINDIWVLGTVANMQGFLIYGI